jgi:DNA invertase Pin-like site-specific DNA recombinase
MTPRKNDLPWFAYIRVSDKDQGDKYGPSRQVEAIRNWMRANVPGACIPGLENCVITPREVRPSEYVGFDKQTGKNDERRDFQRGLQMAKAGLIGGFLSLRLDRVARNAQDALILRSRLKRMDVRLEFATQAFDNTATGDLMFTVYAGFAELEGKLILERTAEGRIGRLSEEKLFPSGGSVPFGYLYVDEEVAKKNPGATVGMAIIYEPEARIVRMIFRWYIEERLTAYQIMLRLNEARETTRKGCAWWRETVSALIRKADRYAGEYVVRLGIEAAKREHQERVKEMGEAASPLDLDGVTTVRLTLPAILDSKTARRALAIQSHNKVKRAGRPTAQFALSKLVHCAVGSCESVWYFRNKGRRQSIGYCSKHNHQGGGIRLKCRASEMAYPRLEALVMEALKDHLRQPEVAHAAAMQAYRAEHGKDATQQRADAEGRLAALREEQKHNDSIILNPALKRLHGRATARFSELEIQIQDLERDLRRAPVTMMYSEASIVEAFRRWLADLEEIETFEEKREFFEATLQRVDMAGKHDKIEEVVLTGAIALGQTGENWNSGLGADSNFTQSFPFVIRKKVRAA